MRRAAVSIRPTLPRAPAGHSRQSTIHEYPESALEEGRYYLILSRDLGYGELSS